VGFGIPVVLVILSTPSFFLASPIYVKSEAKASWLAEFARVLVASFRNTSIKSSSQAKDERYQTKDFKRTPKRSLFCLMFLNKACVIQNEENLTPDGRASDPWNLNLCSI
jgi:peptide/histidine transporter 3/4